MHYITVNLHAMFTTAYNIAIQSIYIYLQRTTANKVPL